MSARFIAAFFALLTLCAGSVFAAPAGAGKDAPCEFPDAERIVVVGTVAGYYDQFRGLLRDMELIDEKDNWAGGTAHLVQLGNLYGDGPSLDGSVKLLMKLEGQAAAAGGMVHVLHGKSENMVLGGNLAPVNRGPHDSGYLVYASPEGDVKRAALLKRYSEAFDHYAAGDPDVMRNKSEFLESMNGQINPGGPEYLELIAPGTEMGDWLRSRNVVIRIGDTVFSYGGVSEEYCETPLEEINERFRSELRADKLWMTPRVDRKGPLWWAELSARRDVETRALVEWILHKMGARAMVVGHSPVIGHERRGRVYHVDSRMHEWRDVEPLALEIVEGRFVFRQGETVFNVGSPNPLPEEAPPAPVGLVQEPEPEIDPKQSKGG